MENTGRKTVEREQVAFRLTKAGKGLLEQIAEHRGVSLTAVVEQLIREEADKLGFRRSPQENGTSTTEDHQQ